MPHGDTGGAPCNVVERRPLCFWEMLHTRTPTKVGETRWGTRQRTNADPASQRESPHTWAPEIPS
ncbi:MAG TPA: hypothetical protein VGK30_01900 [Candidatus Binatia bacterium]